VLSGVALMMCISSALAENIDPANDGSKYAYAENAGWVNARPGGAGGPGVHVEDEALSGFMWAENIGWISLSCANTDSCGSVDYGVTNDGLGNLQGYAWSENTGWLSMSCGNNPTSCAVSDYGVVIDPDSGDFHGEAWSENIGWVSFRSTGTVEFGVTTSWPEALVPLMGGWWKVLLVGLLALLTLRGLTSTPKRDLA
jgi:hypothetical protein